MRTRHPPACPHDNGALRYFLSTADSTFFHYNGCNLAVSKDPVAGDRNSSHRFGFVTPSPKPFNLECAPASSEICNPF
ncbi:hypothetical protein P7K49_030248 [Saguinus oedipus]|uniref:Uncharacterized protein n=1 Tax=Saguinus oedipus TaxID=9490 RepID=A0ABQ9U1M8_SAGOE|nr:hypothetical protein P7K49_030248 [Saguinus oedipus]